MANITRGGIYTGVPPDVFVFDCGPLRSGEAESLGIYIAARSPAGYTGSNGVYLSRDGGTTYHHLKTLSQNATTGFLHATKTHIYDTAFSAADYLLSNARGVFYLENDSASQGGGAWDDQSQALIDWGVSGFAPTSATELETLNGANRILISNETGQCEVLSYKTVALSTGTTYTHTNLIRGRHGTEGKITGNAPTNVVYLDDAVGFAPMIQADVGKTLYFKALSDGQSLSDASAYTIVYEGNNLRPFAPCEVTGTRDSSNNLTFTWERRSRHITRLLGGPARPLGEDAIRYEVDILSAAAPYTLKRTIKVTAATAGYTAAEQTTDGFTPGTSAINLQVYQMSDAVGRGHGGIWQVPAGTTPNHKLYATRTD